MTNKNLTSLVLFIILLAGCKPEASEPRDELVVTEITQEDETRQEEETQGSSAADSTDANNGEDDKLSQLAKASPEVCHQSFEGVNWQALQEADCQLLSQYQLFNDKTAPQHNPNGNGQFYGLSAELFSDYARKYRFIFLPKGEKMDFSYQQTFSMPVGTVLVKTFAIPQDTALIGQAFETLIETRLLIKRQEGWVGLPFVWTENGQDAVLKKYGALVEVSMINQQQNHQFYYEVPTKTTCKNCHQKQIKQETPVFEPIGIKARYLNWSLSSSTTQLETLVQKNLLSLNGADLSLIETVPIWYDQDADLQSRAKGYLDINCAHCHRQGGLGGVSGLMLDYHNEPSGISHGVCKKPPGYDGGVNHLAYDIVPGDAQQSILVHRMSVNTAKDMMPQIGRQIVHQEGVELISDWINSMPYISCHP